MSDHAGAQLQHGLGIGKIDDVYGHPHTLLASFIEDCSVNFRRHLRAGAKVVIQPEFDDIGLRGCIHIHSFASILGSLGDNYWSSDEQARAARFWLAAKLI